MKASTPDTRSRPARSGRHPAIIAGLLTLTLAIGAAARVAGRDASPPTAAPAPGTQASLYYTAGGTGPVHFSGQLDRGSVLAGGDGLVKLELRLRADARPASEIVRVPTDFVVVLDRSGSMNGEPLEHAKASVRELIAQLGSDDRFALVSYGSGATLSRPLALATADARALWQRDLAVVRARGGTNMSSGLDLATSTLESQRERGRAARVILLSDGHANEGDHSRLGLQRRAARAVAGEYVLSTVGVGAGFDESLMTALADAGTGNFYYVRETGGLAEIFGDEFASARETVASAVEVSIEPADGVNVVDAAGYPLDRGSDGSGGAVVFRPGSLFAGQDRRVWVTLRTPVGEPSELELGRFALRFREGGAQRELALEENPRVACVKGEDEFYARIDAPTWARSVLVDDYNALKQKVSQAIRSGDKLAALGYIDAYKKETGRLNARMRSSDVDAQLSGLAGFEDEVEEAFEAPAPARSSYGKQLIEGGTDGRRSGAKRR